MTLKKCAKRLLPAKSDHEGFLAIPIRRGPGSDMPAPQEGTCNDPA